ncbi:hypothetical protein IGJ83_001178 [Enterococcus pernyi]
MIPKFRAWLKDEQEMQDVLAFDTRGHSFLGIEGTHVTVEGWCDVFEVGEQVELMQSTGLKDKNGVEIFEGDIVKTLGADLEETLSSIKFAEGAFCVDYKNLGTEFDFLYFVDSPLEVIGNVYQNSELLDSDLVEVER